MIRQNTNYNLVTKCTLKMEKRKKYSPKAGVIAILRGKNDKMHKAVYNLFLGFL